MFLKPRGQLRGSFDRCLVSTFPEQPITLIITDMRSVVEAEAAAGNFDWGGQICMEPTIECQRREPPRTANLGGSRGLVDGADAPRGNTHLTSTNDHPARQQESLGTGGSPFFNPRVENIPTGELKIPRPSVMKPVSPKHDEDEGCFQRYLSKDSESLSSRQAVLRKMADRTKVTTTTTECRTVEGTGQKMVVFELN
ncbi:hypothetical protein Bbelb_321500 [Branchiostoma belcheri]|nr:hypothetical protein Bbelb_321500 [Branchiostoma belcheri]